MKLKRNYKKCLSTAILLCLMASSAYAMPTGGNVVMGNVTNVNNPAAIMAANAHSIIDWNKFNIAANEKVTFNTNTFTVLNRVTGGYESQILGVLQDQGKGHLILMNPSGIVLGENAVIDANKLTMTSLAIDKNQFKNLINDGWAHFTDGVSSGSVIMRPDAKVSIREALNVYGGMISIADGVEIISKDYGQANVNLLAASQLQTNNVGGLMSTYFEGGNVTIGNVSIGNFDAPVASFQVRGDSVEMNLTTVIADSRSSSLDNKVMISGTDVYINNTDVVNEKGEIFLVARKGWESTLDDKYFKQTSGLDNKIDLIGSSITSRNKDITILGGEVDVKMSVIDSGNNLIVGAIKEYGNEQGIRAATTYDTSTVTIDNKTKVHASGSSIVYGAILNVPKGLFKHNVESDSPFIEILDREDLSLDELIEYLNTTTNSDELKKIRSIIDSIAKDNGEVTYIVSGEPNETIYSLNIVNGSLTTEYIRNAEAAIDDNYMDDLKKYSKSATAYLQFLDETFGTDGTTLTSALTKFIGDLEKFKESKKKYKAGEEGEAQLVSDATNAYSSSIKLIGGMVNVIKEAAKDDKKLSLLKDKVFQEHFGAISGFAGLASTVAAATEGVEKKTVVEAYVGYLEGLKDVVEICGEVEKLSYMKKALVNAKKLSNTTDVCVIAGKCVLASGIQMITSINKYTRDGDFNKTDVTDTFVDMATAGVYELANIGGVGDIIFGAMDKTGGTVSYLDQAATGWKMLLTDFKGSMDLLFKKTDKLSPKLMAVMQRSV